MTTLDRIVSILKQKPELADQLFFDQTLATMKQDDDIRQAALANSEENFRFPARDKFKDVLVERHAENEQLVSRVFDDEEFGETVMRLLLKQLYDEIRDDEGVAVA